MKIYLFMYLIFFKKTLRKKKIGKKIEKNAPTVDESVATFTRSPVRGIGLRSPIWRDQFNYFNFSTGFGFPSIGTPLPTEGVASPPPLDESSVLSPGLAPVVAGSLMTPAAFICD